MNRRSTFGSMIMILLIGCQAIGGSSSQRNDLSNPNQKPTSTSSDRAGSVSENRHPIQIAGFWRAPAGSLERLDGALANLLTFVKGSKPDAEITRQCDPRGWECWCVPESRPWIAKVRVRQGPIVVEEGLGPYPGGSPYDVGLFLKWRYYDIEIVETWLGKPSRDDYQLWDIGGYCPGDLAYCPDGDLIFDPKKCLRIEGKDLPERVSCEYRHPETGELLVRISDLDMASGLQAQMELVLFGADFVEGSDSINPPWSFVVRAGGDPMISTVTGWERRLMRTKGDQVDVMFLFMEDFAGSPAPGFAKFPGERWIPQWMLAQRILERIVIPYLQKHPDDRPFVESALSGPLLQEYLSPTQVPQSAEAD